MGPTKPATGASDPSCSSVVIITVELTRECRYRRNAAKHSETVQQLQRATTRRHQPGLVRAEDSMADGACPKPFQVEGNVRRAVALCRPFMNWAPKASRKGTRKHTSHTISSEVGGFGGFPAEQLGWVCVLDRWRAPASLCPFRLQITAVLTSRHPSMLPGRELLPLLAALHQLLAEQKRGERGPYVLRCLREVARCQTGFPDKAQGHRSELGRLWARVCALALRGVSSPQTEALSWDLLRAVLHGGLVSVEREVWRLLSGSACQPSP